MKITTKEWLMSSLVIDVEDNYITRNGRLWKSVAGFRICGCIFAIYQDDYNYCAHSADEWNENEEPNMGYYDKSLSYNELVSKIADAYDTILQNR